jgi:hypothetical protein
VAVDLGHDLELDAPLGQAVPSTSVSNPARQGSSRRSGVCVSKGVQRDLAIAQAHGVSIGRAEHPGSRRE